MSVNLTGLVNELRATLGKMEVALGAIADAIVWTGSDGKIQWCNAAFDKLVNQPHILVLNVRLSDLLPLTQAGEYIESEFYPNVKILEGDYQPTEYEFQQDNDLLIVEISGNCFALPEGEKSAVLVIRDITQAKRWEAEHTIAEQEQARALSFLQATLESTADGILVLHQDRTVQAFNQKYLQMWSIPESYLQDSMAYERFMFMAHQTRDPEAFIARVNEIVINNPAMEAFDLVELKDGRVFERYSIPQWSGDEIIGRVWSFQDITARRQAEAALSESEAKFRRIVENANDIISLIDLEGTICYISPNLTNLTGYDTSELEGVSFANFIHPDDLPRCIEAFQRVVTTGEKQSGVEYRARIKDGTWQWQATGLTTTQDINGNLLIISVARVINEQKQAEEALRLSEQKLRSFVESNVAGILFGDVDGSIKDANDEFLRIIGYTRDELDQGEISWINITSQEWLPLDEVHIAEAKQRGACTPYEKEYIRKDGSRVPILVGYVLTGEERYNSIAFIIDLTARKQAEEDLRRSNAILKAQQEASIDGILVVDEKNRVVSYNQRFCQLWQISETVIHSSDTNRQLLSSVLDQLEQPEEFLAKVEYLYAHPEQVSRDEICMKDGRILDRYSASVKSPTEDYYGRIWYFRDISDRKQAEESLRQSEARFRALYKSTNTAVVLAEDGIPFDCNMAAEKLFGYSCQELLSKHAAEVSPPYQPNGQDSFSLANEHVALANKQGSHSFEWVHRRANGTDFPAEVWLTVVQIGNRKLMQSMIQDLTERKQAEAALEHRAREDSLLTSISRHFIDQDVDTAINFTLQAVAEFMGTERSCIFEYCEAQMQFNLVREWCAVAIEPLFGGATGSLVESFPWSYNQILSGKTMQISDVAKLPLEAATEKGVFQSQSIRSVMVVPTIHAGKVVGFLGTDVVNFSKIWSQEDTNLLQRVGELIAIGRFRHQAEEALRVAKVAAETANRSKSAFLANMSHELRTPLNAILGFAQLMERDNTLNQRQRDSLATINRSGEHLLNLINDVLEMSKIEAGRIILNPVSFDLHRLLQTIKEMFQVRAEAKKLLISFELAPDLPQYILTDEGKLRQVVINLLGNAIKFTKTGGVTLRVGMKNSHFLHFEIEDTGTGIATEDLDQLFQPFVQTASGAQVREGTGLGLTISRQFVQLMGGDIYINSVVNKGSTFAFDVKIELALPKEVAPQTLKQKAIALAPGQPVYKILVVDDRQENCDLLTQLLISVGFEARAAANGIEAIDLWQTWHPHLIWMDMRMPVMDGYEATRQIRAIEEEMGRGRENSHTVIIALTASAFEEQRSHILAAGCDDLIRKPFREEVIFNKMAEYLQLQYIYASEQEYVEHPTIANTSELEQLKPQSLLVMPSEWRVALEQAAVEVDAELITLLIQQIPETYFTLVQGLADLVERFCFDEIIDLVQGGNNG